MASLNKPSVLKELEEESDLRIFTGPAKRIIDKLAPMSSHVEAYQKRWFWELLQNACDYNNNVKVELEITSGYLSFRHNGAPFTMNQALNLILPDSDKDEKQDKGIIGKYGSGFISTHILSSEIQVSGFLTTKQQEEHSFEFTLDRSNREEKEKTFLANSLRESQASFSNSLKLKSSVGRDYTTEFKYNLSKNYQFVNTKDTVTKGLSFFRKIVPFVFAFQTKLSEISIKTENKNFIYSIHSRESSKVVMKIKRFLNGELPTEEEIAIHLAAEDGVHVATEVAGDNIVQLPDDLPKLFKVYPLVGTEEFPFPCVVHSLDLIPTQERNSIELSDNDNNNRLVLQKAIIAYKRILSELSEQNYSNLFHICKLTPSSFDSKVNVWFKPNISDILKETLLNSPIVLLHNGARVNLRSVKIPILENKHSKEFYKLIDETIFIVPTEDEVEQWEKILNFTIFNDIKFDFKNLLTFLLGQNQSISNFLKPGVDVFQWIKQLINLILLSDEKDLLYEKSIIPRQDNHLCPLKSDLFWDNEISEELKDILELISEESFRKILMHKSLEEFGDKLLDSKKEKSDRDILDAIDKSLQKASEKEFTPKFLEALNRILKWTSKMEESELKTKMSWFASERPLLVMKTFASSDEKRDLAFKIIQSGKMEILAQLAASDISSERLQSVIQLSQSEVALESLSEIAAIAKEIPMKDILETARELQSQHIDKIFKTTQGVTVEKLVEDILNEDCLTKIYQCEYRGLGEADFVIRNLKNGNEAFLEIKSHAHGSKLPSKLYPSQARKAVASIEKDNFILGVITRPTENHKNILEYIRSNMLFTFSIGGKLEKLVHQYEKFVPLQLDHEGVSVEFDNKEVKFTIDRTLTDSGYPFGGFKTRLKQVLDKN